MSLTERQLEQAIWCAGQELGARRAGKPPGVRPWNAELIRALELELATASSSRQDGCRDPSDSDHEDQFIGSVRAARILGWTVRQVQRYAADLEAEKISGKLVFRTRNVIEYAEALTHARDSA